MAAKKGIDSNTLLVGGAVIVGGYFLYNSITASKNAETQQAFYAAQQAQAQQSNVKGNSIQDVFTGLGQAVAGIFGMF